MERWHEFFGAEVGAAAALAGLLMVAASINIAKILEHPILPSRVAQTLATAGGVLVVASLGLIPDQSSTAFGVESLIAGMVLAGVGIRQFVVTGRRAPAGTPLMWRMSPLISIEIVAALFLIGGALLASSIGLGMFVASTGLIAGLVLTMTGGWVLLIEILR
jgi:modulator of FtsH protease